MIRYIPHKEIDTEQWDACVNKDQRGLIYGFSWYLDMVSPGWDGMVLNDYEAVLPLPVKTKWGIPYIMWPYGAQQLGVFTRRELTAEIVLSFLSSIPRNFLMIDIRLNEGDPVDMIPNDRLVKNTNYLLSLSRPYEQIYEGYSGQIRRNLKKAQKHSFRIFEHDSPEALIQFFRREKGSELPHLTDWHYKRMQHVQYVLLHKRRGEVWTIHDEHNTICAGAFFVRTRNRLTYLFGAANDFARQTGAMTYLFNEVFIFNSGQLLQFDFEGSNHPGIARFFEGFGARPVIYHNYQYSPYPPLRWWMSRRR